MRSGPNQLPDTANLESPISTGFLNLIHIDPGAAEVFAKLLEIAEAQSPGVARTFLYDTVEDELVRATLERAFDERGQKEKARPDSQPVPPNIHEQTKLILDSGLAHLMMERMPSDIPQRPPFSGEFWVQTDFWDEDGSDHTRVMVRWLETYGSEQRGTFHRIGFRAEPGIPFGHDGHAPLEEEHLAIVDRLSGWRAEAAPSSQP